MPPRKKKPVAAAVSALASADKILAGKRQTVSDVDETNQQNVIQAKPDPKDIDEDDETPVEEPPKKKARRSNDGLLSHAKMTAAQKRL
jgi:hypothetical protein